MAISLATETPLVNRAATPPRAASPETPSKWQETASRIGRFALPIIAIVAGLAAIGGGITLMVTAGFTGIGLVAGVSLIFAGILGIAQGGSDLREATLTDRLIHDINREPHTQGVDAVYKKYNKLVQNFSPVNTAKIAEALAEWTRRHPDNIIALIAHETHEQTAEEVRAKYEPFKQGLSPDDALKIDEALAAWQVRKQIDIVCSDIDQEPYAQTVEEVQEKYEPFTRGLSPDNASKIVEALAEWTRRHPDNIIALIAHETHEQTAEEVRAKYEPFKQGLSPDDALKIDEALAAWQVRKQIDIVCSDIDQEPYAQTVEEVQEKYEPFTRGLSPDNASKIVEALAAWRSRKEFLPSCMDAFLPADRRPTSSQGADAMIPAIEAHAATLDQRQITQLLQQVCAKYSEVYTRGFHDRTDEMGYIIVTLTVSLGFVATRAIELAQTAAELEAIITAITATEKPSNPVLPQVEAAITLKRAAFAIELAQTAAELDTIIAAITATITENRSHPVLPQVKAAITRKRAALAQA